MLIKKKFLLKKCSSNYNIIKKLILNIDDYKCKYDYLAITHKYKKHRMIFVDYFAIDLKAVLSFIKTPEISIINIIPKNY